MKKLFKRKTNYAEVKRYCEIEFGKAATAAYNLFLAGKNLNEIKGAL